MSAREALIAELREHALVIGDVVLTSGSARRPYYIDAKRAILLPRASPRCELLAARRRDWGATRSAA